jgi:hypothetical protein
MFSKQETSNLRKEFWTVFGQYMSPILSAEGQKINWINYKTGIKGIQFKTEAEGQKASVSIELNQPDRTIQQIYFEQFLQLKKLLHNTVGEEWQWLLHIPNQHGNLVSKIYKDIQGVTIMRKEDWPILISFFKPRLIALDEFWSSAKYSFEALQ